MSIIRVKKDGRYFTASNEPFNDKRLTWETRGLLGFLLSKPNNWQVRMDKLEKEGPAGNYKLRRMLSEARMYGYMNRIRITTKDNKFDWVTEVYESPSLNPRPSKGGGIIKSSGGFSTSGFSTSGKPRDLINTEEVNTNPSGETTPPDVIRKWSVREAGENRCIKAYQQVTGYFPGSYQWIAIVECLETIGIDMRKMSVCWAEWALTRGYNPKSLNWLLDWYANGIPPRSGKNGKSNKNGNGTKKDGTYIPTEEDLELARRIKALRRERSGV